MFVFLYQHWYCKHYDVRPKNYSGFIDVPYISAYTTRVVRISFHHKLGEHRLERLQQKRAEKKVLRIILVDSLALLVGIVVPVLLVDNLVSL